MSIFRISFINQNKVYQLHARQVQQGDLYGFVEISELLFDEQSSVVIDPAEEKLKSEFSQVIRIQVPVHAVIRIDEVEKRGTNKILSIDKSDNVTHLRDPAFTPGKPGK